MQSVPEGKQQGQRQRQTSSGRDKKTEGEGNQYPGGEGYVNTPKARVMSTGAGGAGAGQTLCAAGCRVVCCPRAAVSAEPPVCKLLRLWQGT